VSVIERPRGERGVAPLELALSLTVLFGVIALVLPLAFALREQVRLERSVGQTTRFATRAYFQENPGGTVERRPSAASVRDEARRAMTNNGVQSPSAVTVTLQPSTLPVRTGQRVTITFTQSYDLGAFGGLLDAVGLMPSHAITLTASASAIEE
jgi:hypothetical protein